jgi:hypothetical protein
MSDNKIVDVQYEIEVPWIIHQWLTEASTALKAQHPGADVHLVSSTCEEFNLYRGKVAIGNSEIPFKFDWATPPGETEPRWLLSIEVTPYDVLVYGFESRWKFQEHETDVSRYYVVANAKIRHLVYTGWVIEAFTGQPCHREMFLDMIREGLGEITDFSAWIH